MKTAFVFSGQGSQFTGMGSDLYQDFSIVKDTFEEANDILGYSLTDICFKENDLLNLTEYTQPAVFTMSVALLRLLEANKIKPDIVLGLSLGEYSALVASGVISFQEGLNLVSKRSQLMSAVVPPNYGKMVAVLNTPEQLITESCQKVDGLVSIANYNTYKQLVVGGEAKAVDQLVEILKAEGVKKIIPLNVSGPFHTSIYEPASEKLAKILKEINWQDFKVPLISNVTAEIMEFEDISDLLAKQVMSPVKFYQSIEKISKDGVTRVIELGPGRVLSGFIKKIDKNIEVHNVENVDGLDKLVQLWEGK